MVTRVEKQELLGLLNKLVCACGHGDCEHERLPMVDRREAASRLGELLAKADPVYPYRLATEVPRA